MGGRSGANTVENEIGYATTNKRKSVVTLNNDDTRPKVDRPNLYGELREEEDDSIATGCRELRHREASQRGGRLMCTVHVTTQENNDGLGAGAGGLYIVVPCLYLGSFPSS